MHLMRGALGFALIVGVGYAFCRARARIDWPTVAKGLIIQGLFAAILLKIPVASQALGAVASVMVRILDYAKEGAVAVFGQAASDPGFGGVIAFQVLPSIVFFSALTTLLYHWNVLPWLVKAFAWALRRVMPVSGAESLALAANVFLGPVEATIAIKPYLAQMTRSELFCLMTAGMSTIAGGVMVAYIAILGGDSDAGRIEFGRQLMAASLLSAPAAVVAAKILVPETEKIDTNHDDIERTHYVNSFDAICHGTNDGLRLALAVGAILIVFIALVAGVNDVAMNLGAAIGLNDAIASFTQGTYAGLSLQFVFGLIFSPVAWAIGVDSGHLLLAGQLLGEKTALNEFIAYGSLSELIEAGVISDPQQIAILTFALCGFANFASMGIMIGGLYTLAPERRSEIAKLGLWSILTGTMASLMTACWAGIFY